MSKKGSWIKRRHQIVRNLVYLPFYIFSKLKFGIRLERYKGEYRPMLILYNHQTSFDQFFISLCFKRHIYFIATEDLFSNAFVSRLLSWAVAPIPFRKSTADVRAIRNCIRVARAGGSIALAPEGNRTYSGTTENIKPSVASLAKALKLPLAFYRIEGGYGVEPRWADKRRKGTMRGYFSRVLEPCEYMNMNDEELYSLICRELYVDEREDKSLFLSNHSAEYLERAIYYCHNCGLSRFESHGNRITCQKCGQSILYNPDKTLSCENGDFPYLYVKDWYDAQCDYINSLDLSAPCREPLFTDTARFSENIYCKRKLLLAKRARLSLFTDKIEVQTESECLSFSFDELSAVAVLGRNKLNIYIDDKIFQFKGDRRFNALKYVNLYYRAEALKTKGSVQGFLGL